MKRLLLLALTLILFAGCKKDEMPPLKEFLIHFSFDANFVNQEDNANNGMQNGGVTFVEDRFGKASSACFFDGINDRIKFNNTLAKNASEFSVSAWYKVGDDFFNGNLAVVLRDQTVSNLRISKKDSIISTICFDNYISSDWRSICNEVDTTNWFHLVGVYKKDVEMKLYINGALVTESTSFPSANVSADPSLDSYLGAIIRDGVSEEPNTFWNGSMDDFRLYQKTLTDAEVLALYQNSTDITNL